MTNLATGVLDRLHWQAMALVVASLLSFSACGPGDPPVTGGEDAGSDTGADADDNACTPACESGPNSTVTCNSGVCELECDPGFADENGDPSDGCEAGSCEPSNNGVEVCDGLDNDCNGVVDNGFDVNNDCTVGDGACEVAGRYVCSDDGFSTVCDAEPGDPSPEVCGNEVDEDCDGELDDADASDAVTWYADSDGDGYGDPNSTTESCSQPSEHVDNDGDCDDSDLDINPDASEICDDVDEDCDGTADNGCDKDGDGWCDANATISGEPAVCSNGVDDCDDDEASVFPGAPGKCDGLDNDCNGQTDEIRGVPNPTPGGSLGFGNQATDDFPSMLMAAPSGDGYCVYAKTRLNSAREYMAYVEAGASISTRFGSSNASDTKVLQVAGDADRCLALVTYSTSSGYDDYLSIRYWDRNNSTGYLSTFHITENYYQVDNTNDFSLFNGSLRKVNTGSGSAWAVGYIEQTSSGGLRSRLALLQEDVENATGLQSTRTFEDILSSDEAFADYGMPPTPGSSPNINDDYAVVWFDAEDIRFKLTPSSNFSSEFDLATANFGAEVPHIETMHGQTFYGFERQISDDYAIRLLANNYAASADGSIDLGNVDASSKRYYVRDTMTAGPGGTQWFINGYEDEMVLLEASGGSITDTSYTHPAWQAGDHLLAAEQRGDTLEVLRLTSESVYTFSLDEFTCY